MYILFATGVAGENVSALFALMVKPACHSLRGDQIKERSAELSRSAFATSF
jgi:hypothetical protein